MLEFILCDDQKKHNEYLKQTIEKVLEKRRLSGVVSYVSEDPVDIINFSNKNKGTNKSNVYILDLDFPGDINGVKIAEKIRENELLSYIIFASAHQGYAMLCYKVRPFDFLLKPLNYKIIDKCIKNVFENYYRTKKLYNPSIPIRSGSKIYRVDVKDIIFIEKYSNIAIFHTTNGVLRTYASLNDIQEQTEEYGFYRCHKSYLVNILHVDYLSISQNYLLMKNKKKVLVSQKYKKGLIDIVECRI